MNPAGNAKFNLSQAEGVHNLNDKCIYNLPDKGEEVPRTS